MTDQAFVGRMYLERAGDGSPAEYTRICEVNAISGLGETNDQIDITNFCSGGNREYVPGLADGSEITIDANYIVDSANRLAMIADVKNKVTRGFRLFIDDDNDGAADELLYFSLAMLSWTVNPSVDDRNTISFTGKISGDIDIQRP